MWSTASRRKSRHQRSAGTCWNASWWPILPSEWGSPRSCSIPGQRCFAAVVHVVAFHITHVCLLCRAATAMCLHSTNSKHNRETKFAVVIIRNAFPSYTFTHLQPGALPNLRCKFACARVYAWHLDGLHGGTSQRAEQFAACGLCIIFSCITVLSLPHWGNEQTKPAGGDVR